MDDLPCDPKIDFPKIDILSFRGSTFTWLAAVNPLDQAQPLIINIVMLGRDRGPPCV